MTDTQPDALGYAIGLASRGFVAEASELRRLHSLNQELLKALKEISAIENQEWGADWEEIEQATLQMQQSLKPKGQTMTDTITLSRSVVEQPQVEQEPVAWLHADGKHQPLYTHQQNLNCKSTQAQPPRQPLTDEEITELADAHMEAFAQFVGAGEVWFEGEKEFARAIEAAHGIGGEK